MEGNTFREIRHEVNNQLAIITAQAELVVLKLGPGSEDEPRLRSIIRAAFTAAQLLSA